MATCWKWSSGFGKWTRGILRLEEILLMLTEVGPARGTSGPTDAIMCALISGSGGLRRGTARAHIPKLLGRDAGAYATRGAGLLKETRPQGAFWCATIAPCARGKRGGSEWLGWNTFACSDWPTWGGGPSCRLMWLICLIVVHFALSSREIRRISK